MTITASALLVVLLAGQSTSAQPQRPIDTATRNAIAMQAALDRAGFSSGIIDGKMGANTRKALDAYRAKNGANLEPLSEPLVEYRITEQDVAGPYTGTIPSDLIEQSKLPALDYAAVDEAIAERFHTTAAVLRRLNPTSTFAAGDSILVPNVDPMAAPAPKPTGTAGDSSSPPARPTGTAGKATPPPVVVTVSKSSSTATVTDEGGTIIFFAPVTTGSEHDPLPIGEWKVNGVQYNPTFRYNPDLFWDADPSHTKAKIPAGPNNPVGLVWIDISKEHYGLHGTPEPQSIGRTQSHGCVRLTNWDALRLASLVAPGTKVVFKE